jgi:hypothetical protein
MATLYFVNASRFHDAFEAAFRGSPRTAFVTHYTLKELQHMKRLYLVEGDRAGMAVKDHGDGRIEGTALFNQNSGIKGVTRALLRASVKLDGVNYVECFGEDLATMYAAVGFKVASRDPFSREYAPADWKYDLFGTPDYFTMKLPALRAAKEAQGRTKRMKTRDSVELEIEPPTAVQQDLESRPAYYKAKAEAAARASGVVMTPQQRDNNWDYAASLFDLPSSAELRAQSPARMAAESVGSEAERQQLAEMCARLDALDEEMERLGRARAELVEQIKDASRRARGK